MLRVTVDTNAIYPDPIERIRKAVGSLDVEIKTTTVTHREHSGASSVVLSPPIAETAVWDESHWDSGAVFGDDDAPAGLEAILDVIGNGSFPKPGLRDSLTPGQSHQLRDAMILQAHAREGRDILVSDDVKGFIGKDSENRRKLEAICGTRIMTVDEFCEYAEQQRGEGVS